MSAGAQTQRSASATTDDARWYPWIGCWQRSGEGASTRYTCVKPSSDGSADILTIANGAVESREHLVVDGVPHPIDRDGCRGSQTATWASSGNRIYIGAAYSCSGGMHGRSTRMFAILPSGIWLELRDVHSGGGWAETITRFHDVGVPASVPADVRSEISRRELAIATARAAASAPVSASDIAEATRSVDTVVVQSWLAARGQAFAVDSVGPGGAQAPLPRVYSEPSPTPSQPAPRPEYSAAPMGCDAFGCYEPNVYSSYNGYVYSPYVQRYVYYGSPYYVPYLAPLIVVRGGARGPTRGHAVGAQPPVIHTPGGAQRPMRPGPVAQTPVNHAPPPAGHTPPRGMPARIRP
jgi:hypothetical protein